ncbi:TetR family transcriptional regulator [Lysobacteraceae bacterium NML95-0200]|nr:TetR family transcriptional regulator [Xanthomonadaceae bacterium NML95-0200]
MNRPSQTARSRRAAHSQAQRQRILDAARQCFAERGFHAASMAQIAETADISTGLIYRYFSSKSELIHGIVEAQMQALAADIKARQQDTRPPVPCVMEILGQSCHSAECDGDMPLAPTLMLEITAESRRDPLIAEVLTRFNQQIDAAIAQWLSRPQAEGGFAVPAAKIAARSLALRALMDGLKQRLVREPDMDMAVVEAMLQDLLPRLMGD